MANDKDEHYTVEETERRAIAAIKRALNTPHEPHAPLHKVDAVRKKPKDKDGDKPLK